MDFSTYLGNAVIDHLLRNQSFTPPTTLYLSAHTADPGLTGTSEVSGAGYARQAVALSAASSKSTSNSAQIQIPMPSAGGPYVVSWLGVWDALTTGNFLFRSPLLGTNQEVTVAASTDLFASGSVHGLTTDDRVAFENTSELGPALPAGIAASTIYYVLASGLTTTAFKVSTTSGGAALDVTADGACLVRKVSVKSFNATDLLQVSAAQLSLKV